MIVPLNISHMISRNTFDDSRVYEGIFAMLQNVGDKVVLIPCEYTNNWGDFKPIYLITKDFLVMVPDFNLNMSVQWFDPINKYELGQRLTIRNGLFSPAKDEDDAIGVVTQIVNPTLYQARVGISR